MHENNIEPKDLDAIGTNVGPGSFTGIRACTTVARMMAQQLDIKACGISSLEILEQINPTQKPTMVALDARKIVHTYFIMAKFTELFNLKK